MISRSGESGTTEPSFADEFNVSQEYAVLVCDLRLAAVSLPFRVCCHYIYLGAGLIAFSDAYYDFSDKSPEEAQYGSLANLKCSAALTIVGFCA